MSKIVISKVQSIAYVHNLLRSWYSYCGEDKNKALFAIKLTNIIKKVRHSHSNDLQRKDMFMRKVKIFKYLYCLCVFNSLFWKYYFV